MSNVSTSAEIDIGQVEMSSGLPVSLIDRAFDLYGVLDNSGAILDLRGRLFEDGRANPRLLIGQPFAETVFWQSSESNNRLIANAVKRSISGEECRLRLDFRVSADEKVPVDLNFLPVEGEAGDNQIFVWARRVRSSAPISSAGPLDGDPRISGQLLLAADVGEIGLWFWDQGSDRLYSNPKCNELFELTPDVPLTYEGFISKVHPDDRNYIERFFQETRVKGGGYEEEFRVVYSDGSVESLCAKGRSFLDHNGSPDRMVGTVRKITVEKESAAELARVYEREKKARDEAELANRAKDFFLAFVSHELRSPLNAILGWAKILLRGGTDEPTTKKGLDTIEKSARIQSKLINDLVDSARVTSGKIKLELRHLNLVDVVRATFEAQRPAAESQAIEYSLEADDDRIIIFGDSGRLQQVFANLLSNAIKFTAPGGSVSVKISSSDETARVIVSDSGQGIDPKGLPNIFKQFNQGDSENSRRSGGLGLGLSIVNILVGKHRGGIKAESDGVGHGSRFTVELPISTEELMPDVHTTTDLAETGKRLEGVKILIVEDDPDSREVLQIFLEQNGAVVTVADSARSALNLLRNQQIENPDVLISDLAMPEEDGYSLIARIRDLPADLGGRTPAIALSAFVSAESRAKAFESGFDRYLTKPFDPDLTIEEIFSLRNSGEASE